MKSDFRSLEVWQLAKELRIHIGKLCNTFPIDEKYKLVDQMIRASRSVSANIAEGYGRYHYQENIQFCRQARGSLYELIDHFTVCLENDYVSEDIYKKSESAIEYLIKKLNGYIKYLNNRKKEEQR